MPTKGKVGRSLEKVLHWVAILVTGEMMQMLVRVLMQELERAKGVAVSG